MVRINIIVFGKTKTPAISELISYYTRLVGKHIPVLIDVRRDPGERKVTLADIPAQKCLITLSEHGRTCTTTEFKELLVKSLDRYAEVTFVIGNAFGLDDSVLNGARQVLSLSPMTFPHELVPVILLEQIYRALDIHRGGKYHK